jgi:hypothetical protein
MPALLDHEPCVVFRAEQIPSEMGKSQLSWIGMCRVSFGISELTGTFCSHRDLIPFRSPDFPTARYSKGIIPNFRLVFFIVD